VTHEGRDLLQDMGAEWTQLAQARNQWLFCRPRVRAQTSNGEGNTECKCWQFVTTDQWSSQQHG
jgi:hypothetical protein